jgi:hypothetical protein
MLQIQAREAGIPIVSAGNMVEGKMYRPDGIIDEGVLVGGGDRYELRLFKL